MTIVPNNQGLRLLRAWLVDGEWHLDDPLTVLAIAFDEDLIPLYLTTFDAYPLETDPTKEWADALLDTTGRVTSAHGTMFATADGWFAAVKARPSHTATIAKPQRRAKAPARA